MRGMMGVSRFGGSSGIKDVKKCFYFLIFYFFFHHISMICYMLLNIYPSTNVNPFTTTPTSPTTRRTSSAFLSLNSTLNPS